MTQTNIALSAGEAELSSAVKGISEGIGVYNVLKELLSEDRGLALSADANSCAGMLPRTGTGKVKHLSIAWKCRKCLSPLMCLTV